MADKPIEVTIHGRRLMTVETRDALCRLVEAAVEQFTKPDICPRCGANDWIPPASAWPAWTCEPCGWDTADGRPAARAASGQVEGE
jgi:ribosomal protein L37AE/L43A